MKLRFTKAERLCKHSLQQKLFAGNQGFFCYPFKVIYDLTPASASHNIPDMSPGNNASPAPEHNHVKLNRLTHPAQCLITVSSRRFKKATDRNRIKRLTREAYRKNKIPLYAFLRENGLFCLLAFIYSADKILPFSEMESKMTVSLHQLMEHMAQGNAERHPAEQ